MEEKNCNGLRLTNIFSFLLYVLLYLFYSQLSFGGFSPWYSRLLSDRCDKIGRGTLLIRGVCPFGRLGAGGGQGSLGLLGSDSVRKISCLPHSLPSPNLGAVRSESQDQAVGPGEQPG